MITPFCPMIDDETFNEKALSSPIPVVVTWVATWSKPAQAISLPLQEVASQYISKIAFYTMDFDESVVTRERYDIRCVPTLLLFINGRIEARRIGQFKSSILTAFIDSHL